MADGKVTEKHTRSEVCHDESWPKNPRPTVEKNYTSYGVQKKGEEADVTGVTFMHLKKEFSGLSPAVYTGGTMSSLVSIKHYYWAPHISSVGVAQWIVLSTSTLCGMGSKPGSAGVIFGGDFTPLTPADQGLSILATASYDTELVIRQRQMCLMQIILGRMKKDRCV